MLPFVLLFYILRANGVVVPDAVMAITWVWLFCRMTLRAALRGVGAGARGGSAAFQFS